jgi:hypothetical protein
MYFLPHMTLFPLDVRLVDLCLHRFEKRSTGAYSHSFRLKQRTLHVRPMDVDAPPVASPLDPIVAPLDTAPAVPRLPGTTPLVASATTTR